MQMGREDKNETQTTICLRPGIVTSANKQHQQYGRQRLEGVP